MQIFSSAILYWKVKAVQVPKCNLMQVLNSLIIIAHIVVFRNSHEMIQRTLNFSSLFLKEHRYDFFLKSTEE